MRLSFSQDMRQVQKQILAPRMIQSMEILQLPIMALQERIEQELQENEMLEVTDTSEEFGSPEAEDRAASEEERRFAEALAGAHDPEHLLPAAGRVVGELDRAALELVGAGAFLAPAAQPVTLREVQRLLRG